MSIAAAARRYNARHFYPWYSWLAPPVFAAVVGPILYCVFYLVTVTFIEPGIHYSLTGVPSYCVPHVPFFWYPQDITWSCHAVQR